MKKMLSIQIIVLVIMFVSIVFTTKEVDASIPTAQLAVNKLSVFSNGKSANYYFDYQRYAMDYPEIAAIYGKKKTALWNHYKTQGIFEGRIAYATNEHTTAKLRTFEIASLIVNDEMSEYEKIQAVHDWIICNTQYDYDNYLANTIPDRSYNLEGPVLYRIGVCSGYADTFAYFMKVLGFKCDCVSGVAFSGLGDAGDHAWNRVLLNGNYYYIDCCWDDPVCIGGGDMLNYEYFMKTYDEFAVDHIQQCIYSVY